MTPCACGQPIDREQEARDCRGALDRARTALAVQPTAEAHWFVAHFNARLAWALCDDCRVAQRCQEHAERHPRCGEPGCDGYIVTGYFQPFDSVAAQLGAVCSLNDAHDPTRAEGAAVGLERAA